MTDTKNKFKLPAFLEKHNMLRDWGGAFQPSVVFFDIHTMHTLVELYAISEMLFSVMPERIVDYGTANGGTASLFGRWARVRGAKVLTIDWRDYMATEEAAMLKELPVERIINNEYKQEVFAKVQEFSAGFRTLFYCDGGNKALELRNCVRIMKSSDLVVSHDFDIVNSEKDLEGILMRPGPERDAAYVTKNQLQRTLDSYKNVKVVFEHMLNDKENNSGKRRTRLVAIYKE